MKKIVLLLVLVLLAPILFAESPEEYNGASYWDMVDEEGKEDFLFGVVLGQMLAGTYIKALQEASGSEMTADDVLKEMGYLTERMATIPMEEFIEEVDRFYGREGCEDMSLWKAALSATFTYHAYAGTPGLPLATPPTLHQSGPDTGQTH